MYKLCYIFVKRIVYHVKSSQTINPGPVEKLVDHVLFWNDFLLILNNVIVIVLSYTSVYCTVLTSDHHFLWQFFIISSRQWKKVLLRWFRILSQTWFFIVRTGSVLLLKTPGYEQLNTKPIEWSMTLLRGENCMFLKPGAYLMQSEFWWWNN